MIHWEDRDYQDKTWVHFQSYFKTLWTQKTRYGSGSPRKHGFSDSAANISNELTKTSEGRLSINLCEMAVAATSDKEHIQQMSNTADELLAVVKKYQSQIDELIKQNGPLTGALEKLEKGANTNRRQCGLKVKGKDKVTTARDKRE